MNHAARIRSAVKERLAASRPYQRSGLAQARALDRRLADLETLVAEHRRLDAGAEELLAELEDVVACLASRDKTALAALRERATILKT